MKVVKLLKENLLDYLESLKSFGEVWGPVRKGEKFVFDRPDDLSRFDLGYLRTILPPKKFFVPPRFSTFRFDSDDYQAELDDIPKRVLFGIHPCDIHGLLILDKIFKERSPDPYYIRRRERTAIIALSCVPDDKCLARSTNTHSVEEGFDLGFNDLGDFYLVWVGSSLGDDLMRLRLDLFDERIQDSDLKHYLEWRRWRDAQYKIDLDLTGMPDIMELSYESPIWEELGEKCLSCGSCSMVCPTCNCYNQIDRLEIAEFRGQRERYWDSCMFKEYAMVAGGQNFRERRAERVKLYYIHKLKAFGSEFGRPSCVGCGRCIDTCPVEINILTVAKALLGERMER